ncbi:probable mitochondrial proton/calcium exchanger protein at C-terminar half [Coccomyxa sp. Obi]|nr:probable mitochondrial proton/calcium exchanger protein at C-terminar half [Coccomyxa sp. Obi]
MHTQSFKQPALPPHACPLEIARRQHVLHRFSELSKRRHNAKAYAVWRRTRRGTFSCSSEGHTSAVDGMQSVILLFSAGSRGVACRGVAASRAGAAVLDEEEAPATAPRVQRLEVLIRLRKLYRNLLRADGLLAQPSPVYQPYKRPVGKRKGAEEALSEEEEEVERERREAAIEVVAEMQLTAEQLKAGLRGLLASGNGFGEMVFAAGSGAEAEERITKRTREVAAQLSERARKEIRLLPFPTTSAAQAALDARNARYRAGQGKQSVDEEEAAERVKGRIEQAERAVEKFVARRLKAVQPGLQKARATPVSAVVGGLSSGAAYAKGLWVRLNGGGRRHSIGGNTGEGGGNTSTLLPSQLPAPMPTRAQRSAAIATLSKEIDALEQKLQEASKVRETKVRRAGIGGRARLAGELRDMDDEVGALSRALAIRTLQLELEYIYGCLEDEALDIGQGTQNPSFLLSRQGTSDEVALLVAEFALLDTPITAMAAAVDAGDVLLVDEADLRRLAVEIPDLRTRLGIGDAEVFAGAGWTWMRTQAAVSDGVAKVRDGALFFTRGVRLLGSDISSAGRLFYRAGAGASLKPREVMALRRTARDVLTFIPFAVILIAPLTPVGHVLIFSFLQKYFPGFFPSQFTTRRQELMTRYEELKRQLGEAQEAAQIEDEEAEVARAADALARLTAPFNTPGGSKAGGAAAAAASGGPSPATQTGGDGGSASSSRRVQWDSEDGDESEKEGPAARAVRSLEQQVAAAAEEATTGSIEDGQSPDLNPRERRFGH